MRFKTLLFSFKKRFHFISVELNCHYIFPYLFLGIRSFMEFLESREYSPRVIMVIFTSLIVR